MFETYSDSVRKRYIISNRIIQIKDNKETTVASYDYYKNDNIKSVTVGNGIKTDYKYDGDGNVESLITVTSTGEVLVDFNYAYDLNGNRLQKVSTKHQNFYQYDSMNRLKDSSYDGRKESFKYDKVGNRLSKTTNDITEIYVYNARNQLKELHKKDNKTNFTYDKQGNTIKEESSLGINSFEYNTLNQQVKVINKEGNTLISRYDAEGLRCEIEENEKLTKFIFHKENILVETDKDNTPISRFTRGYEVVAADITGGSEESRYYYTQDEQGSTVFITDNNQQIRNEYCYDVFGNKLESKEEVHNRITYTGQQFDNITEQYYLRARFYNPIIGRFTQEDVYRGDGLNLYAYCSDNPVSYYDPSGYKREIDCDGKSTALNRGENTSWNEFQETNKGKYDKKGMSEAWEQYKTENYLNGGQTYLNRPYLRQDTINGITAGRGQNGSFFDANTLIPIDGTPDIGHIYGREFWRERNIAEEKGWTQSQFNDHMNNSEFYQFEDPRSNRSHEFEDKNK